MARDFKNLHRPLGRHQGVHCRDASHRNRQGPIHRRGRIRSGRLPCRGVARANCIRRGRAEVGRGRVGAEEAVQAHPA
jgi:hypothetical protein